MKTIIIPISSFENPEITISVPSVKLAKYVKKNSISFYKKSFLYHFINVLMAPVE